MKIESVAAWDYALERGLKKEIESLQDGLGAGVPKDFSEYQFIVGQIRGIRFAMDLVIRIRERLNSDGDQDLREDW